MTTRVPTVVVAAALVAMLVAVVGACRDDASNGQDVDVKDAVETGPQDGGDTRETGPRDGGDTSEVPPDSGGDATDSGTQMDVDVAEVDAPDGGQNGGFIAAAGRTHSCGKLDNGEVYCWGRGNHGQLGDGQSGSNHNVTTPVRVKNLSTASMLSAGWHHNCVVLQNGEVKCWGQGKWGKLGDGQKGQNYESAVPVKVQNLSYAVDVAAGAGHTCAALQNGQVYCWGYGRNGRLGNGMKGTNYSSATPVKVTGISNAVAVAAGGPHSCAVLAGGKVRCWGGGGKGQLGDGKNKDRATPVTVQGITRAEDVVAGRDHACVRLSNGEIECWGEGVDGQLGNNAQSNQNVAVKVRGLSSGFDLGVGGSHSCAALQNGEAWCWGLGNIGQLGDGNATLNYRRSTPVQVVGLSKAENISAGQNHTCAALDTGEFRCWGDGEYGELGDGNEGSNHGSLTPVDVQF